MREHLQLPAASQELKTEDTGKYSITVNMLKFTEGRQATKLTKEHHWYIRIS
jgi:hypothetical protein